MEYTCTSCDENAQLSDQTTSVIVIALTDLLIHIVEAIGNLKL